MELNITNEICISCGKPKIKYNPLTKCSACGKMVHRRCSKTPANTITVLCTNCLPSKQVKGKNQSTAPFIHKNKKLTPPIERNLL